MILVDTSVWSLAFRRATRETSSIVGELTELIHQGRAKILGPIRQELLSGYSDFKKFNTLREKLDPFPNIVIEDGDFIKAAEFSNICRGSGIQGSHVDFLICAVACRLDLAIFTTDLDFKNYSHHLPIKLHEL